MTACTHCQGSGVIDGWDVCPACFGNPITEEERPAAGPWVKIEPGCDMPSEGDVLLVKAAQLGRPRWVVGMAYRGDFVRFNLSKIEQATHYAIINPPEAT